MFDSTQFIKDMNNVVQYSLGFLDGAKIGKREMLKKLGNPIKDMLNKYIDTMARMDYKALSHVYEWYQVGDSSARLFDVSYRTSESGIVFSSKFSQSATIQSGSNVPFYDKARIMEEGSPVIIKPKNGTVLAFSVDGEQVFTRNPVTVTNPGGAKAHGAYQKTFESFFQDYFSQSLLSITGLRQYLESPLEFNNGLRSSKGGKQAGTRAGYKWITNINVGVEL